MLHRMERESDRERETAGTDPEGETEENDRVGGEPEISDKQENRSQKRRLKDSKT